MKLGIIGGPNEESFISAHRRGLEFLEYCINKGADVEGFMDSLPKQKEWMEKYSVAIGSVGRWGSDRIDEHGHIIETELKKCFSLIEACEVLSCPVFVCGCNYVEGLTYKQNCESAISFFKKLIEYGKEKNVKVAVYNCDWNNFVHSESSWKMIHMELEDLGIKYDPSHAYYAGRDYLLEIKEWGHRFEHFHLKGAMKIGGQRFDDPPVGMDSLKWSSIMAALYNKGYNKGLSIEPHSRTWQGELGEKGIDFTINYIRPFIL